MTLCYSPRPTKCGTRCRPGRRNLSNFLTAQIPGSHDVGCYVCRNVRGGSTLSLHADGRAHDRGFAGSCHPHGEKLFSWAIAVADKIGAQEIIWCRRIWSTHHPLVLPYKGESAHTDHVHIGLCLEAANSLTLADLNRLPRPLTGAVPPAPPAPSQEVLDRMSLPMQRMGGGTLDPQSGENVGAKPDPAGVLWVCLDGQTVRPVKSLGAMKQLVRAGLVLAGQPGHTHEDVHAQVFDDFKRGDPIG